MLTNCVTRGWSSRVWSFSSIFSFLYSISSSVVFLSEIIWSRFMKAFFVSGGRWSYNYSISSKSVGISLFLSFIFSSNTFSHCSFSSDILPSHFFLYLSAFYFSARELASFSIWDVSSDANELCMLPGRGLALTSDFRFGNPSFGGSSAWVTWPRWAPAATFYWSLLCILIML